MKTPSQHLFRKVCLLALGLGCASSQAAILYGTLGYGGTSATLVTLDPTTGATLSTIGAVGFQVNSLAFNIADGKLYGTTGGNGGSHFLIQIDTTTGAGTQIGSGLGANVVNLAINAAGTAYGWADDVVIQDDLVSVNLTTGTAAVVGDSGLNTSGNGMAFDGAGTLHFVNAGGNHYTVNTADGSVALHGTITFGDSAAHHGSINPDNGRYYGVSSTGSPRSLDVLDLVNNVSLGLVDVDDQLHTVAFTPEPQTYALIVGLGLVGFGTTRRFLRR